MTGNNPIADVLASPLGPDWTVEALAEQVLGAIAARSAEDTQEFVLDAETTTDRQTRRLLRPLLACLDTMSATETGVAPNLYGGRLVFKRSGPEGEVQIIGQFDNRPGSTRIALRRIDSSPEPSRPRVGEHPGPPTETPRPAEESLGTANT